MAVTTASNRWAEARRILCVRLDGMGDLIMTTPALAALVRENPDRTLTLLGSAAGAAVAPLIPELDDVIEYEAPWMNRATAPPDAAADRQLVEQLRERRFDAAVIFTVSTQSSAPAALLCHLADIPLRLAHCRENVHSLLTDRVPDGPADWHQPHEVERQLELVATLGCPVEDTALRLAVPPLARRHVLGLLGEMGLDTTRPWAVIHPGATAASRRYPEERYAAAADELVHRGVDVVFSGSTDERGLVDRIRAAMAESTGDLAGRLRVPELAALLALAPVVICNNSGAAHVAAAVRTPVVSLYALTNPQHTPWGVPSRVLSRDVACRNCLRSICPEQHHRCLRGVPSEAVVAAAQDLLSMTPTMAGSALTVARD